MDERAPDVAERGACATGTGAAVLAAVDDKEFVLAMAAQVLIDTQESRT